MPITIEVVTCTEENDGDFTVKIRGTDTDTGTSYGPKSYKVSNAVELKNKIKPVVEKFIAEKNRNDLIRSMAQSVIDEIMSEVEQ